MKGIQVEGARSTSVLSGRALNSSVHNNMTDALNEHLLPKHSRATDSLSSDENSDDEDSLLSGGSFKTMTTKEIATAAATALLVTAGVATSAAAMVSVSSIAVYVAGGICILNAPTVAQKQYKLSKAIGARKSINNLRREINILKMENNFLSQSINTLRSEMGALQSLENRLNDIAKRQGRNAEELISLVKENEAVLSKMKFNLRQCIVSDVAKIFITADRNGDLQIDEKDIPIITLKLQIRLEAKGIILDVESFEDMIRKDYNITTALKFCGDILFHDEEVDEEVDESVVSVMSVDFDMAGGQLNETERRLSMFSINDQYSKGSVEVARGARLTLAPKRETHRQTMVKHIRKTAALKRKTGKLYLIINPDDLED